MSDIEALLKRRRVALREQIEQLSKELALVERALNAIEKEKAEAKASERQLPLQMDFVTGLRGYESEGLTIKDMIVRVLFRSSRPLTAREILKRVNLDYREDIPRTSFSPQLSRLKRESRIEFNKEIGRYELTPSEEEHLRSILER